MAHSIEITSIDNQIPLLLQTEKDEEVGKADFSIEITKTNGEDQSGLQTTKSTKQIFDERFKDLNNWSTKSCTISRVSVALSESNLEAYKPKLISIGPYHKHNPELRSMEKYKLRYLQRFLQRKGGIDVESCISEMKELKDEALKCYDDLGDLDSDIVEIFSEILLLDGCFVIEFIRECCGMIPQGEEKIINTSCMSHLARRDILLLENQLPFFVLIKLHDMTKKGGQIPFIKMVKMIFLLFLPKVTPASFYESEGNDKEIKHLLQVVHMSCHPSEIKPSVTENTSMEAEHSRKSLCWNPLKIVVRLKEVSRDRNHQSVRKIVPNATELSEAGINFAKVGKIYKTSHLKHYRGDKTSLFDIKFESGEMKIPCFEVVDNTETLLRNLIAYEQQSPEVHPRYFSDFAVFMDYLIDSDKDVSLLRLEGIINNRIGEDKEVASLFNKIGKGVAVSDDDFYYKEASKKAIEHCEKPWNRMKANLRHKYFNSPWAGISTVAAIILLLLTVTQTVLSFISTL